MYAVTKDDITIREMRVADVQPLVCAAQLSKEMAEFVARELKRQIREKNEESDLLFVVLYKGKAVGKIDIIFTDEYTKNPLYKGMKTDGNMKIEISPLELCRKIADDVEEIFIQYCQEIGLVDVLGLPKVALTGLLYWKPLVILPKKSA